MKIFQSIALLALTVASTASAQSKHFAFTGLVGPSGSLSQAGSGTNVVYLRWDATEGSLPATVTSLVLERGTTVIATLPVGSVMDALDIEALYSGAEQERRKFEIIRWLDDEDEAIVVDETTFATVIYDKLTSDPYWAWQGSQVDINVARARYSAFIDTGAGMGPVKYTLTGTLSTGGTVALGKVNVDTTVVDVLPGASSFRGLTADDLRRCDAPGDGRAHGVIALDWNAPGANAAGRYVLSLTTAGWDLYRGTANLPSTAVPARDLRAEAVLLPHGADGRIAFTGLEKVNDQPMVVTGEATAPTSRSGGWTPDAYQWLETHPELLAAGVEPGDTRAYYLVGRDLSGNYGATVAVAVSVPDLLAPPTLWGFRVSPRPDGSTSVGKLLVRFPVPNVLNFIEDHGRHTWCNQGTARFDGFIDYVAEGQTCPASTSKERPMRVNISIEEILGYRFDDVESARAFRDSDGDGHGDLDERVSVLQPGAACNPAIALVGTNRLVNTLRKVDIRTLSNGRQFYEFEDLTPAADMGHVYWYRFAAVGTNGQRGPLSAPVRAIFPDRSRPRRHQLCDLTLGRCPPDARFTNVGKDGPFARDTTGRAATLRLSCHLVQSPLDWQHDFPLVPQAGAKGIQMLTADECAELEDSCGSGLVHVSYLDAHGRIVGRVSQPLEGRVCQDFTSKLEYDCTKTAPVVRGEAITDPVRLNCEGKGLGDNGCIAVYREIAGKDQRIKLICDEADLDVPLDLSAQPGDTICLSAAVQEGGRVSSKDRLPCYVVDGASAAQMPGVVGFTFTEASTTGTVTLLPPAQVVVGYLVEYGQDATGFRESSFAVGADAEAGLVTVDVTLSAWPAAGVSEAWWVRARTIVAGDPGVPEETLSEWSPKVFATREPAVLPEPTYLAWPVSPAPPVGDDLHAAYLIQDGLAVVELGEVLLAKSCLGDVPTCGPSVDSPCLEKSVAFDSQECTGACDSVLSATAGQLGFVAYRQSRASAGAALGDFVQVSPLVSELHCDAFSQAFPTVEDPFLALGDFTGFGPNFKGDHIVFVDHFPHIEGLQYRYEFVYFDAHGEISSRRRSDWVTAEAAP